MTRAAVYCRLSEEDRDKASPGQDSESIQNQKTMLLAYAQRMGWEVQKVYSDDDYTGSDRSRPAWNALLRDAEAGKFEVVLCKSQSRFTRELEIVEKYLHGLFPKWGVRFLGLVDQADTDVPGNKKARQINGLINEWYLEDLSQNERAVLRAKQRRGDFIGTYPPYGYQKSPENHNRLIVDETAAAVVRRIFALYLAGESPAAIARLLSMEGTATPACYRGGSQRGRWRDYTVRMILKRQVYAGDMVQGTREKVSYKSGKMRALPRERWAVVEGTHEAIVSREDFLSAQERMRRLSRGPYRRSGRHPLSGLVFCSLCGGVMQKRRSRDTDYLRCGNPDCGNLGIPLPALEEAVMREIQTYFSRFGKENSAPSRADPRADCDREIAALYLERAEGRVDEEQFASLLADLTARRERAALPEKAPLRLPQGLTASLAAGLIRRVEIRVEGEKHAPFARKQARVTIYWRF